MVNWPSSFHSKTGIPSSSCFLMACATAEDKYENNVKKLDALITELEQQESVSKDDWKKAEAMLNELQISEKDLENLTEEQAEEYGKLAGRLTKLAMKQGVNSVNDAMDKVNGFLKGLGSALGGEEEKD